VNIVKLCGLALLVAAQLVQPVFAYQSKVQTRSYASKLPSDDLIVVEVRNLSGKDVQWFKTAQTGGDFQIRMIDYSVAIGRSPLEFHGIKPRVHLLESLDKLHDLKVGQQGQTYSMRAFFNEDFIWIEVQPSGSNTAPVRSSYLMTGSDAGTYNYYQRYEVPGTQYANQKELVADIRDNYAYPYDPDFIGFIQYPEAGRKAVLSNLLMTVD